MVKLCIFQVYLKEELIVNFEKYTKLCKVLLKEFTSRFSGLRIKETELKLFSDLFSAANYILKNLSDREHIIIEFYNLRI